RGLRLGNDALAVVAVGEVGHDDRDPAAEALHAGRRLLQAAGPVVVLLDGAGDDGDVGALGREPLRERGTDPAARPGDDDTPAREARAHQRRVNAGLAESGRVSSGSFSSAMVGPTSAARGASASRSNPYSSAALPASTCCSSTGSVPANASRRPSRVYG